jgi:selenoprotein W-related protein
LKIRELRLIPAEHGVFEVWIDDELIHSRRQTGKFPNHEDIERNVDERLAEET